MAEPPAHKMDTVTFHRFISDVEVAWTDGCECRVCMWLDAEQNGNIDYATFLQLARVYFDQYGGHKDSL